MRRSLPKISVETVGHYHADQEFLVFQFSDFTSNAIPHLLPKRLNDYKRYFEEPHLDIPFIDVDITLPPMPREKEYNLKSLLDYLRQKGWPNGVVPDFVTHKNLLQQIASSYEETEIYVVRVNGVTFMYRNNEKEPIIAKFLWVFRHNLTRETADEPFETDGTIRKGLFNVSMDMGDGGKRANILYNGKIDLIDDNDHHNEVKVITGDSPPDRFFWELRSNGVYWQSFFSNSTHLLFGMRTQYHPKDPKTKYPQCFPQLSIFKVYKMSLTELYNGAQASLAKFPDKKQIDDGYEDIRRLLSLIREHVKNDGDGFVFSRNEGGGEWIIRRDDEAVAGFRKEILKNIPN